MGFISGLRDRVFNILGISYTIHAVRSVDRCPVESGNLPTTYGHYLSDRSLEYPDI